MADQEDGARVLGQQVFEQVERVDVEVVGGLVEHQHVAGLGEQARQQQAVALATAERAHGRVGARRREQEVLQVAHDVLARAVDLDPLAARADEVGQRGVEVEVVAHLVEVGDLQVGALLDGAAVGRQLAQDHLEQRGLARAVGAHQADLVAAQDGAGEALDDGSVAEGLGDVFELGHDLAAALALRDFELDAAGHVAARGVGGAQAFEALDARHRARAAGFDAFADPDLFLRQQLVEARVGHGLVGQLLRLERLVGSEVAGVAAQQAAVELDDAGADVVQEGAVVRDQHDAALEVLEQVFQPGDGVEVQVVGRLVEEEHVGAGHQGAGQGHALFHAAREAGDRQVGRQVQALQGLFDALLPVPAVAGLDLGHERFHLIGVALAMGDGFEALAQLADVAQAFADGALHRGAFAERGLLRHVGQLDALLHLHLAVVELVDADHDFQQGGLAGAVAADQADALAGLQREGGVVKQGDVAKGQARVVQGQDSHGRSG